MLPYTRHLKPLSRRLRREMTDAEQRLWYRLRRRQLSDVQFHRQKPLGCYIVDFYAPVAGLVVELDGSQHFSVQGRAADGVRDAMLRRMRLRVMRFDDRQALLETDAVVLMISQVVAERCRRS